MVAGIMVDVMEESQTTFLDVILAAANVSKLLVPGWW